MDLLDKIFEREWKKRIPAYYPELHSICKFWFFKGMKLYIKARDESYKEYVKKLK